MCPGAFTVLYGIISVKIKQAWYLGEARQHSVFSTGIQVPAKHVLFQSPPSPLGLFLVLYQQNSSRVRTGVPPPLARPMPLPWFASPSWHYDSLTLSRFADIGTQGAARVMIGVQLVIAGYQLPAKYGFTRWKEMAMCLLPIMTIMWLCTTLCILATIPKVTFLAALVIGSCVTCTDPILSQAIAKGPFADKYVARPLREIISAEAGANDGFGFPFLMLATYLLRHINVPAGGDHDIDAGDSTHSLMPRSTGVGRLGGGVGAAMEEWFIETWLYTILLSVVYGAAVGYGSCKGISFVLRR